MSERDDYLFDPEAPIDREIAALEEALRPWRAGELGAAPQEARLGRAARLLRFVRARRLAAAAVLLLAAGGAAAAWLVGSRPAVPSDAATTGAVPTGATPTAAAPLVAVRVASQEGGVRVEPAAGRSSGAVADAALRVGDRIVCDAGATARVEVGDVGWLELSEATRLRVADGHGDTTREGAFHLELERGTVAATIFAAPRVFALGTPAGIAVDLGCIYETTVADDGATWLSVRSGRVSFESDGRKVHVPAGASCRAWPRFGPGTPTWNPPSDAASRDAASNDDGVRAAIERYDAACAAVAAAGSEAAVRQALDALLALPALTGADAAPRQSLPLWHLFALSDRSMRERFLAPLVALVPLPDAITAEECLAGEPEALATWRHELERSWRVAR